MKSYDVVVIGAGNAALCSAISAAEQGSSVLVLERAPMSKRGGNSWFSDGAMRFSHRGLSDVRKIVLRMTSKKAAQIDLPAYPPEQFATDLARMSDDRADPELCEVLATESMATMLWLKKQGVKFRLLYDSQAFERRGKHRFWGGLSVAVEGKGAGLVDVLMDRARDLGIEVLYEARAIAITRVPKRKGLVVEVHRPHGTSQYNGGSVVVASGSFESSVRERTRHLGAKWNSAIVRGTEFNDGDGLRMAMELGAARGGEWDGCHAVAMDINAPEYGDHERPSGDIFKRHSYPLGIVVNDRSKRFLDEGADFRTYTYADYGRRVMKQRGGLAFQIFDNQVVQHLREEYRLPEATRVEADTVEELGKKLELDDQVLADTVRNFNEAVTDTKRFDPARLDGRTTEELVPPKTNWALRIEEPPFVAYPVTSGISFAYGGLMVDGRARVLAVDGTPIAGLYAAGETVGGLFYGNYAGGSGLTAGATFGRIAGIWASGPPEKD